MTVSRKLPTGKCCSSGVRTAASDLRLGQTLLHATLQHPSWCFTGGLQTPPTDFLTRNSCSSAAQQITVGWHWQPCQAAVNSHIHIRSGSSLLCAKGLKMHLSGTASFLYSCISSLPAEAQHSSWFVAMLLAPPKPGDSSSSGNASPAIRLGCCRHLGS